MTTIQKPHVLLAIRTLSGGGAELVVETLCTGLTRERFDVTVCEGLGQGEKGRRLRERGFTVVSLVPDANVRQTYFNFLRLRRLVGTKQIDLVHSHSPGSLADAAVCKLLSPRLRIVHTFHFGNYPNLDPSSMRLERTFLRLADALVAVGHAQADAIKRTYGLADGRLTTIWNGIRPRPARLDHERLAPIRAKRRIIIGTIGTLIEQKGFGDLLDVAAVLRQRGLAVTFVIVGGGPLRDALEQKTRSLGVADCVDFLGWVWDAAETVMPAFDIFFQPSRWEAMSMVLLEAAAAGLPIVSTDVGEASRIMESDRNAFIVPQGDVQAMASALERLVVSEPLRRQFGDAARTKVEQCCLAEAMVRRYEDLYSDVLTRPTLRALGAV